MPDSRYLALHAACARVAHYSGVGDYIEKILSDIEEMDVLADDGSSGSVSCLVGRCSDADNLTSLSSP